MIIANKSTLFKKNGNKMQMWQISVEYQEPIYEALIVTEHCSDYEKAKVVRKAVRITSGKNIGRANETSILEQAISEAASSMNKKLDQGYKRSTKDAEEVEDGAQTNALGLARPMLAKDTKGEVPKFPIIAQYKLNGHRCLAKRDGDMLTMWSRGGKVIDLPHIRHELMELLQDGQTVDGELYCHGVSLQDIGSLIKRPRKESEVLGYFIYDEVSSGTQDRRLAALSKLNGAYVQPLGSYIVNDNEELNALHKKAVAAGFEGLILRDPDGLYTQGKRTLIKFKEYRDAEFIIVGYRAGVSTITNGVELAPCVFTCLTQDGKPFEVLAHGTQEQKMEILKNAAQYVGKRLTVKYFSMTNGGIPEQPVSLGFYDPV